MSTYRIMERYQGDSYPEDGFDDPEHAGLYVFCDDWGTDPSGEPYYETKCGCPSEVWMNLLGDLNPGDTIIMLEPNSVALR